MSYPIANGDMTLLEVLALIGWRAEDPQATKRGPGCGKYIFDEFGQPVGRFEAVPLWRELRRRNIVAAPEVAVSAGRG